jgi:pimeloyl-ACP methyl ester carboxylesterase
MDAVKKNIDYKNSKVQYLQFGTGGVLVCCLHGFGEAANSFSILEKNNEAFTFFAIDMPLHGETKWNESLGVTPNDILNILELILEKEKINKQPFVLIGYSLGARVALSVYEKYPDKISKLIVIAPDGMKVNFWYWLSTQTFLGNLFLKFAILHSKGFLKTVSFLRKAKLINTGVAKFASPYLHNEKISLLVYKVWTAYRHCKPNMAHIKNLIKQHQTKMELIYGRNDNVIAYKTGEKFRTGIEDLCEITILEAGHQILKKKYAAAIINQILDNGQNH